VDDTDWLAEVLNQTDLLSVPDAVEMSRYLFVTELEFTEVAQAQLRQDGSKAALQAVLEALTAESGEFTEGQAQAIVAQVVKSQNVKKGLLMKSLRAALTGDLQGPDLIQSWLLLHQHQQDHPRLRQAIALAP
jgi:glutamyl-tRNA synthetase